MGRSILGAVLGYVAMVIVVVAGTGLTWLVLGPTGAFRPGETVASNSWSAMSCVFGLIAAIAGGITACLIDRTQFSSKILIGIVLVFGLLSAGMTLSAGPKTFPEGKQVADLGFVEAGQYASSPTWYNFAIPVIGIVGVIIGSRLIQPKHAESQVVGGDDLANGSV